MAIRFLFCVFLGLGLLAPGAAYAAAAQGYVHEVRGDVQAVVGGGKPVKAEKNQYLNDNTTITTGANSNAVIKFIDGTVIALNQNTSFTIQKFDYNEKAPSTMTALFSMLRGGLRVVTGAMSQKHREGFKLSTPSATIGIRGTEFMVQRINPTYLSVINGAASVSNAAGSAVISAGQFGFVASATSLPAVIPALPPNVLNVFGNLPGLPLPPAVPGALPSVGGLGAVNTAAGGLSGAGIGAAAAAAAAAAAVAGGGSSPAAGTTGTTGTQ